jgi:hypothetical protein
MSFNFTLQNYMPELLPGDMCVYEFLWRTPNACPLSEKTEQPHKDDSCTVVIPGTDNRYGDVLPFVESSPTSESSLVKL